MDIGDFGVTRIELEFVRDKHEARPAESRRIDEERRAKVTTDSQAWANNPDEYDFPGVDTPSSDPRVLPKDFKHSAEVRTSARASNEMPAGLGEIPEGEASRTQLANTDVSLSPDEAFGGVATSGIGETGNTDIPVQDKTARFDATPEEEQRRIDRAARRAQSPSVQRTPDEIDVVDETHGAVMDFLEGGSQVEFTDRMRDIRRR